MMKQTTSYYRARLEVIEDLIKSMKDDGDEKNNDRVVLRNGVFPESYNEKELLELKLTHKNIPGQALTFEELTRFNNWFAMHPEKVAGREVITSSREFPISIVGTKEDILKTLKDGKTLKDRKTLKDGRTGKDFHFELELKRKTAKAKLKLLSI